MITDLDREYIGKQIEQGFTSGQFGSSAEGRIAWSLTAENIDA